MTMVRINVHKDLYEALNKANKLDQVPKILLRNGTEMQQKMMRGAPVDTGFLRRSIGISSNRADRGMSIMVKPTADYASYLEYGTRYMGAQPFVRPAFYKQTITFLADLENLLK